MEFHVTCSYNIFGNGMVMHIKVCDIDFRYTGVIALCDCLHFNELVPTEPLLGVTLLVYLHEFRLPAS